MRPGTTRPLVQPAQAPHTPSPKARTVDKSLLFAALAYACGQVANFLFQLRLLDQLGPAQYGETGLAHLALITLIFLADLGYSSLFLREVRNSANWQHSWRYALGHRLLATLLLLALVTLGCQMWGSTGASRDYLFWAIPACLFALFNYSSPMIAEGRRLAGLLVAQVAWPTALLIWWLLPAKSGLSSAATAGLAFSLGYLSQALTSLVCSRRHLSLWLPMAGKGQLGPALHLSLIGICGTLHDRLTPFLLAPLASGFLPTLLILNHVLSGFSGIQAQLARLLLPGAGTSQGQRKIVNSASLVIWATVVGLLIGMLLQDLPMLAEQRQWLAPAATLVLAWGVSASSGFFATSLIGAHQEKPLLRLLMAGMIGSALLQISAAWMGSADALLWARLLGMLAMLAWLLRLLKLRLGRWGCAALGLSLPACTVGVASWAATLGAMLLLPALVGLLRQAPCYVPVDDAEKCL